MKIISRWHWLIRQFTKDLWFSILLYSLVAVLSVFFAGVSEPFIPDSMAGYIHVDAVDRILGILASSMLAVTTFSLATMVTAHGSVISNTSPRASTLIVDNDVTRNALGAFIGSFLFSLVGIIALSTGSYGDKGHIVLFFVTICVVLVVIGALLRWIDHLTKVGRVGTTIDKLEQATFNAMIQRGQKPCLGGRPLTDMDKDIPADAVPLYLESIGYVQHVDMKSLITCADQCGGKFFMMTPPGSYVDPTKPAVKISGLDEAGMKIVADTIRQAFSIGDCRTFEYDPRFGLVVMSEIAARAASPDMNDQGTVIDVIGRVVRVMHKWGHVQQDCADKNDMALPDVWVPPLYVSDLFNDIFPPIARDTAHFVSVQIRLQKAFLSLSRIDGKAMQAAARHHSALALERMEKHMDIEEDKKEARRIAAKIKSL